MFTAQAQLEKQLDADDARAGSGGGKKQSSKRKGGGQVTLMKTATKMKTKAGKVRWRTRYFGGCFESDLFVVPLCCPGSLFVNVLCFAAPVEQLQVVAL